MRRSGRQGQDQAGDQTVAARAIAGGHVQPHEGDSRRRQDDAQAKPFSYSGLRCAAIASPTIARRDKDRVSLPPSRSCAS